MKNSSEQNAEMISSKGRLMENQLRQFDLEYGFQFTDEEIRLIARQTEKFERLFRCLYDIDLTGVRPFQKVDRASKK